MLKNILNLEGVTLLTKPNQKAINGGYVNKCCVRPPSKPGQTSWCNSNSDCYGDKCACESNGGPQKE